MMIASQESRAGRPRRSSRDMLEEAAAELFMEQTYAGTTIEQITQRAGVSRNTFFNYFAAKSDLLWSAADEAIEQLDAALAAGVPLVAAVTEVARSVGPDRVPVAMMQAEIMGTRGELVASGLVRVARLADLVTAALTPARADTGTGTVQADTAAYAIVGAIAAAWSSWARDGVGRRALVDYLDPALDVVRQGASAVLGEDPEDSEDSEDSEHHEASE